jgi:KipI family sensor histidine kinase inhibitor
MFGFAPGFTFLGGLPDELAISRRATPRPPAPPGSLLIAGGQALITTIAMPTGWYVIGQTPVRFFDPARPQPFLANVGDEIVFERIGLADFEALKRDAAAGALIARAETA